MAKQEQIEALKIDENVFELGEDTQQDFKYYFMGTCYQLNRLPSSSIPDKYDTLHSRFSPFHPASISTSRNIALNEP